MNGTSIAAAALTFPNGRLRIYLQKEEEEEEEEELEPEGQNYKIAAGATTKEKFPPLFFF